MSADTPSQDLLSKIQISVHTDHQALKDQWLALESHAKDPFCGYAWCSAWYETMPRTQGQSPYIIAGHSPHGKLLLLLPLVLEKQMSLKVLSRPARDLAGDYGAIIDPSLRSSLGSQGLARIWKRITKKLRGTHLVILNGVTARPDNALIHLPHLQASAPAFSLQLSSDWEAQYDQLFTTKMKRNDRRSIKRINEAGTVTYHRPSAPKEQQDLLAHLLEQKRRQIEAVGEDHHLSRPEVQAFYERLPEAFAQSSAFDLALTGLSLNEERVATSCGIRAKGRYFGLFMAMGDGPARKFSPGRLLLLEINRHLCEQGVKVHEFGNGEYKYKESWNCIRDERITITAPTSTLGTLLAPLARKLLERRRGSKQNNEEPPAQKSK